MVHPPQRETYLRWQPRGTLVGNAVSGAGGSTRLGRTLFAQRSEASAATRALGATVGALGLDARSWRAGGSTRLGRTLFARRWEHPAWTHALYAPVGAPGLDARSLRAGGSTRLGRTLFTRRWEHSA